MLLPLMVVEEWKEKEKHGNRDERISCCPSQFCQLQI